MLGLGSEGKSSDTTRPGIIFAGRSRSYLSKRQNKNQQFSGRLLDFSSKRTTSSIFTPGGTKRRIKSEREMFGRLRPPPSPPDCLERYPAKIIKDDPLSVYESTLLKLKQGSRLDISSEKEGENLSSSSNTVETSDIFSASVCSDTQRDIHDVALCNGSDAMAIDSGPGEYNTKQLKHKNPSILSMFCRYNNLVQARNSPHTVDTSTETKNHS